MPSVVHGQGRVKGIGPDCLGTRLAKSKTVCFDCATLSVLWITVACSIEQCILYTPCHTWPLHITPGLCHKWSGHRGPAVHIPWNWVYGSWEQPQHMFTKCHTLCIPVVCRHVECFPQQCGTLSCAVYIVFGMVSTICEYCLLLSGKLQDQGLFWPLMTTLLPSL